MATQVAIEDLDTWLEEQPTNTVDTPYEIEVTNLTRTTVDLLASILRQYSTGKFVDLSYTQLPAIYISQEGVFANLTCLIKAPIVSSYEHNIASWFAGCSNLKEATIPCTLINVFLAFRDCTSLSKINIYGSVDFLVNIGNYEGCFYNCTNLTSFNCDRPYELKQWLTTIYTEDTNNFPNNPANCTYRPFSEVVEVPFSDLNNELSAWSANTTQTPYKLNVTGLIVSDIGTSGTVGTLGNVILSNGLKYVDLRHTVIPSGVIDMHECFSGCTSLTTAPNIPARVTIMQSCFSGCTSLTTAPDIPARVTSLAACFDNCRSLITAPDIPSGVTSMGYCFSYCTSLTTAPKIPDSVTDLTFCFNQCRSLITAPNIPSGVTMLRNCFSGCRSLTTAPKIPDSVTNMYDCFGSCTSLTTVPNIPDSVQNLNDCFSGCTSLEEITLFEADLATLVTNNKAQNCFYNCPNLTKIGTVEDPTPHEFSDWNIYRLKFDSNSVQGKVFHRDGTSHSITQTSITKSNLQLPILTDELWFPTESDSDIESIIAKMIQYKYGVFKKEVIPPDEKSFVLMADDPDKVITNLVPDIDVVDTVQSGNMKPVTSNAVAGALNPLHIAKGGSIYADGTKANYPIIKMKDNTSDVNGNGIVIGGGGATVIGGGESADTYYSGAGLSAGSETMVVANDGAITFASNLQDGYASRKEMTMGTDGKLTNSQGFVGNISGSSGSCTGNSASASRTLSRGNVTCETGTTVPAVSGVSMSQVYSNGYPTTYGNVITLAGAGHGQLLLGWSGTSGARADAYIRSKRDVSSSNWSDWYKLIDSGNIGSQTVNTATHIPTSKADNSPGAIWIA